MPDTYNIDSHKLQYHPNEVSEWLKAKSWDDAKTKYPIYVELSPINKCNSACGFCGLDFVNQNQKATMLDEDAIYSTISIMAKKGIKSVMFGGSGEPTIYPKFPNLVKHCWKSGIGVGLTTNLVKENSATDYDKYIHYCKWIKISLNAGDRETYKKIHGKDDFDKVIRNISELKCYEERSSSDCTIGTQIVLLDDNYKSLESLIKISRKYNLDYCVIKPYSQHLSSITTKYKEIDYKKYIKRCEDLKKKYDGDNFEVIFRKNTMLNKDQEKIYQKCYSTPNFWTYIEADGAVYTCSCFIGDEKFYIGNINQKNFDEIWESEKRRKNYLFMKEFDISKCRSNCRMENVNKYLWRLKNPESHDSFI